ncbi:MAG: hypothetical protein U0175_36685, partial [Caldilineaceae bacterium]
HANGSFHWLGRWDNVINSGGVKVQVEKVEAEIEQLIGEWGDEKVRGRRFFVAGMADERFGERVTLVMEGKSLSTKCEHELLQRLKSVLGSYELPRKIEYVAQFPATPTGKIDRKKSLQALIDSK